MTDEGSSPQVSSNNLSRVVYDASQIPASVSKVSEDLSSIQTNIMAEHLGLWQNSLASMMTTQLIQILDQSRLTSLMAQLREQQTSLILEVVQATLQSIQFPALKLPDVFEYQNQIERASQATGWLPYRTVPFEHFLKETEGDMDSFIERVQEYYDVNQHEIANDIAERLSDYSADDKDKDAIRECLEVHQLGYFRLACLGVLPVIERVARTQWLRIAGVSGGKYAKIKDEVRNSPFWFLMQDGQHEWAVIKYILEKLYCNVLDENREEVSRSPFPNRHAASHGWANYDTSKHSLNAIICADYLLRVASFSSVGSPDEHREAS